MLYPAELRVQELAEREGFEPSMSFWSRTLDTPLAGERLQPLGHLSQTALCTEYSLYGLENHQTKNMS